MHCRDRRGTHPVRTFSSNAGPEEGRIEMSQQEEHLRKLQELFEEAPVTRFVGQELKACADGAAQVSLPFREELVQGEGVVHGGIISLIADTAGYFAAASLGHSLLATAQISVNLIAPVREEDLVASGEVIGPGKRLVVCELRVHSGSGSLVAAGQGTYTVLG